MALLKQKGPGEVLSIVDKIKEALIKSGGDCTVLEETNHQYGSYRVVMLVFEKYYGRSSNKANCTVLVSGANNIVVVDVVAPEAGGASNILSRFSWGMDEDYICILSNLLAGMGFQNDTE